MAVTSDDLDLLRSCYERYPRDPVGIANAIRDTVPWVVAVDVVTAEFPPTLIDVRINRWCWLALGLLHHYVRHRIDIILDCYPTVEVHVDVA